MSGKSPVVAPAEQAAALHDVAGSDDRAEADRARAIVLTLAGWTSPQIAMAFGVREDTVRLWRSEFAKTGVEALKRHVASAPSPHKAQAALRVAQDVPSAPVTDRTNWTLPRLIGEIERREGVSISRSRLSVVLRQRMARPVGKWLHRSGLIYLHKRIRPSGEPLAKMESRAS